MSEVEAISIKFDDKSAEAVNSLGWQQEQSFKSSEPIYIHGLIDEEQRGSLVGSLTIERNVIGDVFQEKRRYARLNSVSVHPHPNWRRKGLGSEMINKFEEQARKFGASEIIGEISSIDYAESPWLINFYEKLGFILTKKGEGYTFKKELGK